MAFELWPMLCMVALTFTPVGCSSEGNTQTEPPNEYDGPRPVRFGLNQDVFDPARDGSAGEAAAMLDANLDGELDLVIVNGEERVLVALGRIDADGQHHFDASSYSVVEPGNEAAARAKGLGLHDFNNDGAMDVYLSLQGEGTLKLSPDASGSYDYDWTSSDLELAGLQRSSSRSVQLSQGDGTFTTMDIGLNGAGSKRHMLFDDFDGDGDFDAYLSVAPYYGIWWNGGTAGSQFYPGTSQWDHYEPDALDSVIEGTWKDEHGRGIVNLKGAVIRDFDGDGRADIITGAYADIWNSVRIPPGQTTAEQGEYDLDGDGLGDGGFQGTWARGLGILRNVSSPGELRFENESATAFFDADGNPQPGMSPEETIHVHAVIPADIDRDGDVDVLASGPKNFTTHTGGGDLDAFDGLRLYRNDSTPGHLRFTEITEAAGMEFMNTAEGLASHPVTSGTYPIIVDAAPVTSLTLYPSLSAGAAMDIDNDGFLDFVMVDRQFFEEHPITGEALNLTPWVWHNDGTGRFTLVDPAEHGLTHAARDMTYGDLNHDGRIDLVTVNGSGGGQAVDDGNFVFLNQTESDYHYVELSVSHPNSKLGLGARVNVCVAGTACQGEQAILGTDEVRTDFCYRSKRSPLLHFGLGPVDQIDIVVTQPNGEKTTFDNLPADQIHTLDIP